MAALLGRDGLIPAADAGVAASPTPTGGRGLPGPSHFAPKAKHVIYLHMVGGPPQMDMYDYKPTMDRWFDKELPDSIRMGQRLTTMTSGQKRFPIAPSKYKFARHGQCGMWVCELLPYTSHDGRRNVFHQEHAHRGHQPRACDHLHADWQPDHRPPLFRRMDLVWSGSLNDNLPTFVVLVAKPTNTEQLQAISARLWSSGYLSGEHAGVSFRSGGDPILFIQNPAGVSSGGATRYAQRAQGIERDELPARGRPRDAYAHRAI